MEQGVNVRVVGIDPGTKSFDIVVLEGEKVVVESSVDTISLAANPQVLIDELENIEVDAVVAPSGYGIPLDTGRNIKNPRRLAIEVLLLSDPSNLVNYDKRDEIGVGVYKALADITAYLTERFKDSVFFIPGVIHLPTVPWYRKINKVDMGTADKLASTYLAVFEMANREGIDYDKINMVVVELGFGYSATIAVESGKVIDGIGGTYASTGTLTNGALDLEIVAGTGEWSRWDVAHGGILEVAGIYDMNELIKRSEQGEELYSSLLVAYVEGITKDIKRELAIVKNANIVVLTGRFSRISKLQGMISDMLGDVETIMLKGLKGASMSKESAQGYAAIGAGLFNEAFRELLVHMEIEKSCGTVVDYVYHPRAVRYVNRVKTSYIESVVEPKLCLNQ